MSKDEMIRIRAVIAVLSGMPALFDDVDALEALLSSGLLRASLKGGMLFALATLEGLVEK